MLELGVGSLLCLWVLRHYDLTRSLRRILAGLGGAMVVVGLPFGMRALSVSAAGSRLLEAHVFWPLAVVAGREQTEPEINQDSRQPMTIYRFNLN